ncbi:hybrid sensor histidine kinase/response regulator transcription factor [Ochrovirga pacifica]|uniref:hybrid sensor histidine kinase/response regulator transcription factor n=1 Tax=Ochrovirga pacifica TaxID=1042376 RepID=UPI0002558E94|nr:two-component regulator propeller domain-containing protein [Ochrovirga pacifica]
MKKHLLFLVCLFLFCADGFSQVFTKNYKITQYQLPIDTYAGDLLQDQYGFVWIATTNGLWRYDGGSFKNYLKNELDPTSITDNHISCLFEDTKGDLWIGTYGGGLLKYIRECDCFERFVHNDDNPKSLSFNEIKVIYETSDGQFFIGTDGGGLNLMDRKNKSFYSFKHQPQNPQSLSHNNVLELQELEPGKLLIGTWRGLNLLNYKTRKIHRWIDAKNKTDHSFFIINKIPRLKKSPSWKILDHQQHSFVKLNIDHDTSGNTWAVNWKYVSIYSDFPNQEERISLDYWFQKEYFLHGVFKSSTKDEMWVLSNKGTFFRFQKKERVFDRYLSNQKPNNLLQTQRFIWMNCANEVILFDKQKHTEVKRFKTPYKDLQISNTPQSDRVSAVDTKFFYRYQENGTLIEKQERKKSNHTRSFLHTTTNQLWMGEILGVQQYQAVPFKQQHYFQCNWDDPDGVGYFHRCVDVFEDSRGNIWLGTTGDGLKKYQAKTQKFKHFRHKIGDVHTISNNFVDIIYEDLNAHLWVGTQSGLSKISLENEQVLPFEIEALKDKIIQAIQQDQEGNFWVGTTNGLVKFNEKTQEVRVLNTEDGLLSNRMTGGSLLLDDGSLVFGTDKGLMRFDPKKIKASNKKPHVYLSKLWVNNFLVKPNPTNKYIQKNIEVAETLHLDYTDSKFEIAFQAIHFSNNKRCKYAYKLEGYDDKWTYTHALNSKATYTNIPPGKYTFLVKASNEDQVWNNQEKSLMIIVAPPFWDLWWVRTAGFITLIVLIFGIFRWFIHREKAKSKFELEKERLKQFDEISQMKLRFFTNISHELRTPLTLITAPLHKFSDKGIIPNTKVLKMMYRNSIRLLELINQILDFRKFENKQQVNITEVKSLELFQNIYDAYVYWAKEKHIQLQKDIEKMPTSSLYLDVDVVQKITSNLISNAVKYTPDYGKVMLRVSFQASSEPLETTSQNYNLIIEVIDNGKGIDKEYQQKIFERYFQLDKDSAALNSSGIGLSLCADLVALHKGTIALQSEPNKGAHFTVILPLHKPKNQETTSLAITDELLETNNKELLLLVEDNEDIRAYLENELNQTYTVITAKDGKEGLTKAVVHIPDLIISDIMMPMVDGIQLTQQLKANELTSHIPVIFLTAKTGVENKLAGLHSGGHDYIQKPFHISEVQLKIKNILKTRRELIQKKQQTTVQESQDQKQDQFLISLNECLHKHLENTSFGVESLCLEMGISRSQLYRKLQSLTGKSIIEYMNFYKLSAAMEMLKKGNTSVKNVAFSVGFDDSRYFSRVFKNHFGHAPSYYLKKNN